MIGVRGDREDVLTPWVREKVVDSPEDEQDKVTVVSDRTFGQGLGVGVIGFGRLLGRLCNVSRLDPAIQLTDKEKAYQALDRGDLALYLAIVKTKGLIPSSFDSAHKVKAATLITAKEEKEKKKDTIAKLRVALKENNTDDCKALLSELENVNAQVEGARLVMPVVSSIYNEIVAAIIRLELRPEDCRVNEKSGIPPRKLPEDFKKWVEAKYDLAKRLVSHSCLGDSKAFLAELTLLQKYVQDYPPKPDQILNLWNVRFKDDDKTWKDSLTSCEIDRIFREKASNISV